MAMLQFIRSLLIRAKVEGASQAKTDLDQLAQSQERVTKTTEASAKKQLSVAQAFEKTERRFNSQIKAQYEFEKVQQVVNRAVAQNPALQDRANVVLADAKKHFDNVSTSGRAFNSVLVNMQGSAMALAAQLGGVGAILVRLGPAGVAAAAGIGGAILGFKGLANGVNQLAEESGKMVDFSETVELTTRQIRALEAAGARVGVEAPKIATGFEKFAQELNELRDGSGRLFNELIKINPELITQLGTTQSMAEAWNILTKAMDQAGDQMQKIALGRAAFGRAGAGMVRLASETQAAGGLEGLTNQKQTVLPLPSDEDRKRWDTNADAMTEKARQVREAFFGMFADDVQTAQNNFLIGLEFLVAKMRGVDDAARKIRDSMIRPASGTVAESSISIAELQSLQQQSNIRGEINAKLEVAKRLKAEAEQASEREAQATLALVNAHRGLTIEQAKTVEGLREQARLAGAVSEAEQMQVQYENTLNRLLREGATLQQAQRVAGEEYAVALARANANADKMLDTLRQENELLHAGSEEEERRIKARQTYDNLRRQGVEHEKASAVANQQFANEEERAAQAAEQTAQAVGRISSATQQAIVFAQEFNARWERNKRVVDEVNEALKFTGVESAVFNPRTGDILQMPDTSNLFRSNQGGFSQFNPQGYTSSWQVFETPKTLEQQIQEMFTEGRSIQEIFQASLDDAGLAGRVRELFAGAEQATAIQQQLNILRSGPRTLENELMIQQLTEELRGLTEAAAELGSSTDTLNQTMQQGLSAFYGMDPRTTRFGFRAGSVGNTDWMLPGYGADNPLLTTTGNFGKDYGGLQHGFAQGGSFVVPGGYSASDNRMVSFPAASGETVSVSRGGNERPIHYDGRIIINGNVDERTMDQLKRTAFQIAQQTNRTLQAATG